VTKADKSKAVVIIDKTLLHEKVSHFLQDDNTQQLKADPTDKYQKQILKAIQKCKLLINKKSHRYLTNIQPKAPKLNAYIKTYKESMSIRPVVNNTQASSHRIAKFINTRLQNMELLPNTYNIKNATEIAEEISKLHINQNMRLITLDIKDLYTNLPTQGIIRTIKFWLHRSINSNEENNQTISLLETIMEQNYFQYNGQYFKPLKAVAMGSPLSGTLAELYLQRIEKEYIKQWIDSGELYYYKRYVDDIIILYNNNRTQEEQILQGINHIDKNLSFKLTTEH